MLFKNMNLNILRKASPHLDERSRAPITFLLKLNELTDCIQNLSHIPDNRLQSCDSCTSTVNTEALLRDIRPECNRHGRDAIDLILNLSKTRDFYNTYKTLNEYTITPSPNNPSTSDDMYDKKTLNVFQNTLSDEQLTKIEELSKAINN